MLTNRTQEQLLHEIERLQWRLQETEEALEAFRGEGAEAAFTSISGKVGFLSTDPSSAYRSIMEALNEGVLTLDEEGVILYSNSRFREMVGEPLVGMPLSKNLFDYVAPSDRKRLHHFIRSNLIHGQTMRMSMTAGGKRFPVNLSARVFQSGERTMLGAVITDLSEAYAAEEARFRLAAIVESSDHVIIGLDVDGSITSWNRAAEKVYGHSATEAIGRPFTVLIPPAREKKVAAILQAIRDGHTFKPYETQHVHKDGHILQVALSVSPVRNAEGKLAAMAVIVSDISDHKRAEQELYESQRFIQKVADTAPFLLYVFDLKKRVNIYHNSKITDLLGYTAEETRLLAPAISPVLCHPDDVPALEEALNRCVTAADGELLELTTRIWHTRGEWRWFRSVLTVFMRDVGGAPRDVLGIAYDVTERKQLERALVRASVEEKRRVGQELHDELGQQLTGIAMMLQNLQHKLAIQNLVEATLAGDIIQYIGQAQAEVRRLMKGLQPVEVHANGLIGALETMLDSVSKRHGLACHLECPGPVTIPRDEVATQLFYIAQEAVNNAVKHAKASHIEVTLREQKGLLCLSVYDDGVGIQGDMRRFSGMGLRIMRHRASVIGGNFEVRRREPSGVLVICSVRLSKTPRT